jgi:hypothetical protein
MAQTLTFTIKFNVDPPNVQQVLDAVNRSLKNVGVSVTNVAETSPKLNALDNSFTKLGLRIQGMHNLLSVISGSIGSFIRQSNDQEAATAGLAKALESQGVFAAVEFASSPTQHQIAPSLRLQMSCLLVTPVFAR